jgi:hypothetical protein
MEAIADHDARKPVVKARRYLNFVGASGKIIGFWVVAGDRSEHE